MVSHLESESEWALVISTKIQAKLKNKKSLVTHIKNKHKEGKGGEDRASQAIV